MGIAGFTLVNDPSNDFEIVGVPPNAEVRVKAGAALAEGVHNIDVKATFDDGSTSATKQLAIAIQAALAFPITEYTGGRQGFVFDVSKASSRWANTAGSAAAVLNGKVRRLDDLSGRGHHLLADSDDLAPTLKQDGNGKFYLEFTAAQFMRSAADYVMGPLPHWMAATVQRSIATSQQLMIIGNAGTRFHRIFANSSSRASGALRNSPTLAETIANTPGAGEFPVGVPKVVGSLAIASQNDITVNGAAPVTIANAWTNESLPASRVCVNTGTAMDAASGAAMNFYGAIGYHGNPGSGAGSVRAQGVTWLGALAGLVL